MLTEIYWSFFTTSVISFLIVLARMCYKSKCMSIKCLGCELIRDTRGEEEIDELELQNNKNQEQKSNNDSVA